MPPFTTYDLEYYYVVTSTISGFSSKASLCLDDSDSDANLYVNNSASQFQSSPKRKTHPPLFSFPPLSPLSFPPLSPLSLLSSSLPLSSSSSLPSFLSSLLPFPSSLPLLSLLLFPLFLS